MKVRKHIDGYWSSAPLLAAQLRRDANALQRASYDNAVAQGANQQSANAVRASQNYPMSFTAIGAVLANRPSAHRSTPHSTSRLAVSTPTTSRRRWQRTEAMAISPSTISIIGNLWLRSASRSLKNILNSFYENKRWPRGLLPMIYAQSLHPTEGQLAAIHAERLRRCGSPTATVRCVPRFCHLWTSIRHGAFRTFVKSASDCIPSGAIATCFTTRRALCAITRASRFSCWRCG